MISSFKDLVGITILMFFVQIGLTGCTHLCTEEDVPCPAGIDDGLRAWYSFNGNADDSSGNGIDGTVHGAVPAEDRLGNGGSAYLFDGLDDYIVFGQVLPDMEEMTLCAWVFSENDVNFFNDADWAGGNDVTIGVGPRSVNVRADKGRYDLRDRLDVGVEMQHRWRHVAWTMTDRESNVYIDGTHRARRGRGGANVGYHNFILGTHEYPYGVMGFGGYWKGRISSLRIYHRVLSGDEIRESYERDD